MSNKETKFQLEPFEATKYEELAIFAIGQEYWWIGYDLESCLADANENYDANAKEAESYRLCPEELEVLKFHDEDTGETRTFAQQFEIEKGLAGEFPRFFASEDW